MTAPRSVRSPSRAGTHTLPARPPAAIGEVAEAAAGFPGSEPLRPRSRSALLLEHVRRAARRARRRRSGLAADEAGDPPGEAERLVAVVRYLARPASPDGCRATPTGRGGAPPGRPPQASELATEEAPGEVLDLLVRLVTGRTDLGQVAPPRDHLLGGPATLDSRLLDHAAILPGCEVPAIRNGTDLPAETYQRSVVRRSADARLFPMRPGVP